MLRPFSLNTVVSVPEVFNYWLQPGRIDVGFLGAAQLDRFGNINTTVIGSTYADPDVRLPGAGGAPEIAAFCREVIIIVRQRGSRAAGPDRSGPPQGHHRPRRARAGPGDQGTDADRPVSGGLSGGGEGRNGVGPGDLRRP